MWNLIELVLTFSIFLNDFKPSLRVLFRQHQNKLSYTPPFNPELFGSPFESLIWIVLTFKIAFINNLLLFNLFQLSVVLHIEKVKLQMKPDFCMECYTGLKCVKRVFITTDFKFDSAKMFLIKFSVIWKRLMELVKHLNWGFLQTKLTAFSRKQFLQRILPLMLERILNNTNFLTLMNCTPPNINTCTKATALMHNNNPIINKPLTSPYN